MTVFGLTFSNIAQSSLRVRHPSAVEVSFSFLEISTPRRIYTPDYR